MAVVAPNPALLPVPARLPQENAEAADPLAQAQAAAPGNLAGRAAAQLHPRTNPPNQPLGYFESGVKKIFEWVLRFFTALWNCYNNLTRAPFPPVPLPEDRPPAPAADGAAPPPAPVDGAAVPPPPADGAAHPPAPVGGEALPPAHVDGAAHEIDGEDGDLEPMDSEDGDGDLRPNPERLLRDLRRGVFPAELFEIFDSHEAIVNIADRTNIYRRLGERIPKSGVEYLTYWRQTALDQRNFREGRNLAKREPSVLIPFLIPRLEAAVAQ